MSSRPIAVGIGEILWDVFPDESRFGGAPANFACSVAELAKNDTEVHVVSSVGSDDLGQKALQELQKHNVHTGFVKAIPQRTGQVNVELDSAGHASYTFATDVAWDHLEWNDQLAQLASRTDVVCFGTLGQRSDVSRLTIQRFVSSTPANSLRIFDINLRSPYWSEEIIQQSLTLANVLKLNDIELPIIASRLGLNGSERDQVSQVRERYSLKLVALTKGDKGSLLLDENGTFSEHQGFPTTIVDTVGAGDAFTATIAIGLLKQLPLESINIWANRVASFVCTQKGGTTSFPENLCTRSIATKD